MFFNAPHNEIISLCEYKGTCSRFIRAIAECLICTGVQTKYEFFPRKTRAKPVHLTPLRERLALTPLNLLVLSTSGSLTQSHESRQPPRALPFTAQIQELVEYAGQASGAWLTVPKPVFHSWATSPTFLDMCGSVTKLSARLFYHTSTLRYGSPCFPLCHNLGNSLLRTETTTWKIVGALNCQLVRVVTERRRKGLWERYS